MGMTVNVLQSCPPLRTMTLHLACQAQHMRQKSQHLFSSLISRKQKVS